MHQHLSRCLAALLALQQLTFTLPAGAAVNLPAGKPIDSGGVRLATQGGANGPARADLSTGEATVRIPVLAPPGTGGLTPEVALSYRSGASLRSGPVGAGWSLDLGPAVIERSTRDGAPRFDASDAFDLDGRRLQRTATAGSYVLENHDFSFLEHVTAGGQDYWLMVRPDGTRRYFGAYYVASGSGTNLSRLVSSQVLALEPTSASCPDTRVACVQRDVIVASGTPFAWYLDRIEDRNGNVISLQWDSQGDPGMRYLTRIRYSMHVEGTVAEVPNLGGASDGTLSRVRTLRFTYGLLRPDRLPTYRTGFRREPNRLLSDIHAEVDGAWVRHTVLEYESSPISGRSRLVRVRERGADDATASELTTSFGYGDGGQPGFSALDGRYALPEGLSFTSGGQDAGLRLVDVNGDTYPDVVRSDASASQTWLGGPAGFASSASPAWAIPTQIRNASGYTGAEFGDFDGDGRPDLLARMLTVTGQNVTTGSCGTSRQLEVASQAPDAGTWLNTGSGWSPSQSFGTRSFLTQSDPASGAASCPTESLPTAVTLAGLAVGFDQATRAVDVNGDGRDDLLYKRGATGSHVESGNLWATLEARAGVVLNGAGGLGAGTLNHAHEGVAEPILPAGPATVFRKHYDSTLWQLPFTVFDGALWSNYATCTASQNVWAEAHSGMERLVDLNGDGLPDLLESAYLVPYTGGSPSSLTAAWLNNGYGWQPRSFSYPEASIYPKYYFYAVVSSTIVTELFPDFSLCYENPPGAGLDLGRRLVDVNGDGGPDILGAGAGQGAERWDARVPSVSGAPASLWVPATEWTTPVSFQSGTGGDSGVRLADVNADGMIDLVVSNGAYLNLAEPPDRLVSITSPFGARTSLAYRPSTELELPPASNPTQNGQRRHAAPVWVLSSLSVDPGASFGQPAIGQKFQYFGPVYDIGDRSFRGFQQAQMLGPVTGGRRLVTTTYFHTSDGLRGLPASTHLSDAPANGPYPGSPLRDVFYEVASASGADAQASVTYSNGEVAPLSGVDALSDAGAFATFRSLMAGSLDAAQTHLALVIATHVEETELVSGQPVTVGRRVEQSFDAYGQVSQERQRGDTGDPNDDVTTTISYARLDERVNDLRVLLADRPSTVVVAGVPGTLPQNTVIRREARIYYDHSPTLGSIARGNATAIDRFWVGPTGPTWVRSERTFDAYGNVVERTAPYDVAAPGDLTKLATAYDEPSQTFPISLTLSSPGDESLTLETGLEYERTGCGAPKGLGLVCRITDPNGQQSTVTYDALAREVGSSGPNGAETSISYYDAARGTAQQRVELRVRDSLDGPTAAESANVHEWFFDGLRRPLRETRDGMGSQVAERTVSYDAAGRVAATTRWAFTSGGGPVTTYAHDVLGRPVQTLEPEGSSRSLSYGPRSVTEEERDETQALVSRRTIHADAFDRLAAVEERELPSSGPARTSFQYDPFGLLVSVTDAVGNDPSLCDSRPACPTQRHQTVIRYDELGARFLLDDPDSGVWYTLHDARGLPTREIDPRLVQVELSYDGLGRLYRRHLVSPADPNAIDEVFSYGLAGTAPANGLGRLLRVDDSEGAETFGYDEAGNVTTHERTIAGRRFTFEHVYDPLGRRTETTYPDGETVTWHYDGRLLARISANGGVYGEDYVSRVDYDALDRVSTLGLGGTASAPVVSETRTYDATSGKLDRIVALAGSQSVADLDYTIDGLGRVREIVAKTLPAAAGASIDTRSFQLEYDGLDRLRLASGPLGPNAAESRSLTYTYDALGNLLSKDASAYGGSAQSLVYADPRRPHALTEARTLSGQASTRYQYDGAGNVTSRETASGALWVASVVVYDWLARPVASGDNVMGYAASGDRVRLSSNGQTLLFPEPGYEYLATGTPQASKHFFVGGRRVASTSRAWTAPAAGAPALFAWRGPSLPGSTAVGFGLLYVAGIAGLLVAARRPRSQPGHSPALRTATVLVLAGVCPSLVAWDCSRPALDVPGGPALFYVTDHLGSTILAVTHTGVVRDRYLYRPFGDAVVEEGASLHYRFTGGFQDPGGLYSLGARSYDAAMGRFLQPDPQVGSLADPQSLNRFAYVRNNPLGLVDPSGLDPEAPSSWGVSVGISFDLGAIFRSFGWGRPAEVGPAPAPADRAAPPPPRVPSVAGTVPSGAGESRAQGQELPQLAAWHSPSVEGVDGRAGRGDVLEILQGATGVVGELQTRNRIREREQQIQLEFRGRRGVDVYSHVEAFASVLPEGRSIYLPALTRVDALVVSTGASPPSIASTAPSPGRTPFYVDIRGPLVRDGRVLDVPLERLPQ